MAEFRRDARFPALVERLGLPAYWAVTGPPDGCAVGEGKIRCH
jgi:hypothetical protein